MGNAEAIENLIKLCSIQQEMIEKLIDHATVQNIQIGENKDNIAELTSVVEKIDANLWV